jgi:hypothetical protein
MIWVLLRSLDVQTYIKQINGYIFLQLLPEERL